MATLIGDGLFLAPYHYSSTRTSAAKLRIAGEEESTVVLEGFAGGGTDCLLLTKYVD